MKQTPASLLYIFLSLTSAAPIVSGGERCPLHGLCKPSQERLSSIPILSVSYSKKHTTTTKEPHSPKPQLSFEEVLEIADGPPITITPSHSLDTELPLESSFLLELSKSTDEKTYASSITEALIEKQSSTRIEALPSAPTSALPELRAEEARKLELELLRPTKKTKCHKHPQISAETFEQEQVLLHLRRKLQKALLSSVSLAVTSQEINSHFTKLEKILPTVSISSIRNSKIDKVLQKIASKKQITHDEEYEFKERARTLLSTYDRMVGAQSRKEAVHGDILVVGIVVLFVLAVVIVEAADITISSFKYLFWGAQRRGAIRLPDDRKVGSNGLKRFQLMPAPKGRKIVLEKIMEDEEV